MPIVLTVSSGGAPQEFVVDGPVTIGRAADNQLILDAIEVSRHHAVLRDEGPTWTFTDLGSANGARVDGIEVEPRVPVAVRQGSHLQVGPYAIVVGRPTGANVVPGQSYVIGQAMLGPDGGGRQTAVLAGLARLSIAGPSGVREVPLVKDTVTLGRDPTNDIVIPDDVVSRRHLVLRREGATYRAQDLGTTNGFRYAGQRVPDRLLYDGDVLDIAGVVTLRYLQAPPEVPGREEQHPLDLRGKTQVTVGRSPACDLKLDHPTVSGIHARITRQGHDAWTIEDLNSTNGTFVNGERVVPGLPRLVRTGDVVRLGPIRLVLGAQQIVQSDESRQICLAAVGLNQRVSQHLNLLQDLSFVIQPHEFVAVVGVSGAGKSTLLGALSGLKPASDGEVLLNGSSLYENFGAFRTTLGFVPQDDILHRELPVQPALEYAAALRLPDDFDERERHERVNAVIEMLGLQERRATLVGKLSGGQRKRVSIGAEMLTQPGLFFLDEATSGLDPGTEKGLMRLLKGLADDGQTILLITHATKNVMLCDLVLFLAKGGHLAYFGPPDEALTYFDVEDFDGIYEKLEEQRTPADWAASYRQSPLYNEYIIGRLQQLGLMPSPGAPSTPIEPQKPTARSRSASALRQFGILARRYFAIIRNDRVNFLLLFVLAPFVAALDLVAWPRTILDPITGEGANALTMLFLGALFPFLVGALSYVREIVKESAIYARERAVSLKILPYLGSKLAVALMFALYHALVFWGVKVLWIEFPDLDAVGYIQLYVTIVLAVMSGVMWALLISALTSREEQAMVLAIGVVVLQVVFSGGLVPLGDLGMAGTILGGATSTNWAFKALAAASGITTDGCEGEFIACGIPGVSGNATPETRAFAFEGTNDQFGSILDGDVYVAWFAMVAILAVLGTILFLLQKRKDIL